jgi:ribonuclease HI
MSESPIEKVYFNIPFGQKELAKRNGAKWDGERKCWWFSKKMITPFVMKKWELVEDTSNHYRQLKEHTVKQSTEDFKHEIEIGDNKVEENLPNIKIKKTKKYERNILFEAMPTFPVNIIDSVAESVRGIEGSVAESVRGIEGSIKENDSSPIENVDDEDNGDDGEEKTKKQFKGEYILKGWFDGGSRGNPGVCGFGSVLRFNNGKIIGVKMGAKSRGTNNDAEYMGIIALLEMIEEKVEEMGEKSCMIDIYGDSNLVIQQVGGKWKTHQKSTEINCSKAKKILDRIRSNKNVLGVSLNQIDREDNAIADSYANKAMDEM